MVFCIFGVVFAFLTLLDLLAVVLISESEKEVCCLSIGLLHHTSFAVWFTPVLTMVLFVQGELSGPRPRIDGLQQHILAVLAL